MSSWADWHRVRKIELSPVEHHYRPKTGEEYWTRSLTITMESGHVHMENLYSDVPNGAGLQTEADRVQSAASERARSFTPAQAQARLADLEPYTRPVHGGIPSMDATGKHFPACVCEQCIGMKPYLDLDAERLALRDVEADNDGVALAVEYAQAVRHAEEGGE